MKVEADLHTLLTKFLNKEAILFVITGGMNTLITYGLYLGLLELVSYKVSYTISYICGIFVAFIINSKIVFKTKLSFSKMLKYPLVYVVQYVINFLLLLLFVDGLQLKESYSLIICLMFSMPISFFLNKFALRDYTGGKQT